MNRLTDFSLQDKKIQKKQLGAGEEKQDDGLAPFLLTINHLGSLTGLFSCFNRSTFYSHFGSVKQLSLSFVSSCMVCFLSNSGTVRKSE